MPYGIGKFYTKHGNLLYDGEWVDGVREGMDMSTFQIVRPYKGEVHDGECTGKAYFLSDQTKIEGYFKDAILIDPHDERVSFGTQEDKTNNFVLSSQEQKPQTHEKFSTQKSNEDSSEMISMKESNENSSEDDLIILENDVQNVISCGGTGGGWEVSDIELWIL